MVRTAPKVSISAAEDIAREVYGLQARAEVLPSERDANFLAARWSRLGIRPQDRQLRGDERDPGDAKRSHFQAADRRRGAGMAPAHCLAAGRRNHEARWELRPALDLDRRRLSRRSPAAPRGIAGIARPRAGLHGRGAGRLRPPGRPSRISLGHPPGRSGAAAPAPPQPDPARAGRADLRGMGTPRLVAPAFERHPWRRQRLQRPGGCRWSARRERARFRRHGLFRHRGQPGGGPGLRHARQAGPDRRRSAGGGRVSGCPPIERARDRRPVYAGRARGSP